MNFRLLAMLLCSVLSPLRGVPAVVTHELLADFEDPGTVPMARLLYVPADAAYFGTTTTGGAYGLGTIFRVGADNSRTLLVSFSGKTGSTKGDAPDSGLVLGTDGMLYGTTIKGGTGDFGTVFRVARDGSGFTTLVEFTGGNSPAQGAGPNELLLHPDGFFYGTTLAGGTGGNGTVFKMAPAGTLTTLVHFTGSSGTRSGSEPVGALVANGTTLYGVTSAGGQNGRGVVFSVTTGGTWTLVATLTGVAGAARGSGAASGLVWHNGALYGTTEAGGTHDSGTIFRITPGPAPVFETLRDFDPSIDTDGAEPAGALIVGSDLALYGTTASGGANGKGCVFRITPTVPATFSILASFTDQDGTRPGDAPRAGLIIGPGGVLAGTTSAGGIGGWGTVFKITEGGAFTHVADFTNARGWRTGGGPMVDATGQMLVPLRDGGLQGNGTLWRRGDANLVAEFGESLGGPPSGGLVEMSGAYYGVTTAGGASNHGTVFRYSAATGVTTFATFGGTAGTAPEGPLLVSPGGYLHGVTREGGPHGYGTVFSVWPDGTRTTLVAFTGTGGAKPGARPRAPLAQDAAGNFYGVTEGDGISNYGTVFKLSPTGVFTTLATFSSSGPNSPTGGLVLSPDGNFYGTTLYGGASLAGTVFKITPAGVLTTIAEFTLAAGNARGSRPSGPLLAAVDGTLYGTTLYSGAGGVGTLFKITPQGAISTLLDFTGVVGAVPGENPGGDLRFGPDGKIYGTTFWGGPCGGGTLFRVSGIGPHVATDAPTFTPGNATLWASVQSGGAPVTTWFEYGSTAALGSSTGVPTAPAGVNAASQRISHSLTSIATGSTVFFRAMSATANTTSAGAIRSFTMPAPLAAWGLAHFSNANPDLTADTDGDSSNNLMEYGLVSDPNISNTPSPVATLKTYGDGRRLSMVIQRDTARSDVVIAVEAAPSVTGPWMSLATSTNGAPFSGDGYVGGETPGAGIKTVEIRDVVNVTDAPQRMLRIRVVH